MKTNHVAILIFIVWIITGSQYYRAIDYSKKLEKEISDKDVIINRNIAVIDSLNNEIYKHKLDCHEDRLRTDTTGLQR